MPYTPHDLEIDHTSDDDSFGSDFDSAAEEDWPADRKEVDAGQSRLPDAPQRSNSLTLEEQPQRISSSGPPMCVVSSEIKMMRYSSDLLTFAGLPSCAPLQCWCRCPSYLWIRLFLQTASCYRSTQSKPPSYLRPCPHVFIAKFRFMAFHSKLAI